MEYDGCTEQSTSGWCATSSYENTAAYYSYKYCTEEDWTTISGDTVDEEQDAATYGSSSGNGDTTVTAEYCVPMVYGGVSYEGCTDDGMWSWCATSVDDSSSYLTWAYCGFGNSYGDTCYYPFISNGETYYDCADKDSSPWCATSVYTTYDWYTYKYCDESDLGSTSGDGKTFSGTDCVPMIVGGTKYLGCKDEGSYSWCSTSSDSSLNYITWDYCGLGNSEDCYFPFISDGVTYYGCADKDTDYAWCATSTYLGGQYYNYKYCDADDLDYDSISGSNSGAGSSSGSGSDYDSSDDEDDDVVYTISGEECSFPFLYDGVTYYNCTTKDYGEAHIVSGQTT